MREVRSIDRSVDAHKEGRARGKAARWTVNHAPTMRLHVPNRVAFLVVRVMVRAGVRAGVTFLATPLLVSKLACRRPSAAADESDTAERETEEE